MLIWAENIKNKHFLGILVDFPSQINEGFIDVGPPKNAVCHNQHPSTFFY